MGGLAYVMLVACITLDERYSEESMRTLDFAKKLMNIKVDKIQRNETQLGGYDPLKVLALEARVTVLEGVKTNLENLIVD